MRLIALVLASTSMSFGFAVMAKSLFENLSNRPLLSGVTDGLSMDASAANNDGEGDLDILVPAIATVSAPGEARWRAYKDLYLASSKGPDLLLFRRP